MRPQSARTVALLVVGWFGIERRRFQWPPLGTQIEQRRPEVAEQERLIREAG